MSINDLIDEIKALPHFRRFACNKCDSSIRVHALQMYGQCSNCGEEHKCRGYGAIGTEVQDVIDAVLEWAGQGETWSAVRKRHAEIMNELRNLHRA